MKRRELKGKVKQILQIRGKSLSVMLMVAALAAMLVGLLASTPATAQDGWSVPDYVPDPTIDTGTGCDWASTPDCSLDGGGATASPSASPTPTATPTASPTASPSAPATTASPSASAAGEQYGEPLPDSGGEAAAPAQTGRAEEVPDTGGRVAAPAETTEASGPPETSRNSSALPLMLGSGALLVGGGLLARRLIR